MSECRQQKQAKHASSTEMKCDNLYGLIAKWLHTQKKYQKWWSPEIQLGMQKNKKKKKKNKKKHAIVLIIEYIFQGCCCKMKIVKSSAQLKFWPKNKLFQTINSKLQN